MKFKKYQHICLLNSKETEGILNGTVYVQPKIDGTNSSIWLGDDGEIHCGSRNRELSIEKDNQHFCTNFHNDERFKSFFNCNPNIRLYGEYLIPHSLRTYKSTAWNKFYVFDVIETENDSYLTPENYIPMLKEFNIDYIPVIAKLENPTFDDIKSYLDKNTWLIQEGLGIGEGIVIKNFDFFNIYGRKTWGKLISADYSNKVGTKERYKLQMDIIPTEVKIVEKYCTPSLVEKEYQKIINGEIQSKNIIASLLGCVYHSIIEENMWDIVNLYKNPTIDFKVLKKDIVTKIKEIKADLFVKE